MSRALTFTAIALVIAACTPGRIDRVYVASPYNAQQYHPVPRTKALRAEVSGNPFNMEQGAFDQLVSDSIQPAGVQEASTSPYRIHFAFNGPSVTSVDFACEARGRSGSNGGDVVVVAALCPGGGPALTYLTGSISGVTGPDDPAFRQFLRSATVRLFPPRDRNDQMENCFLPEC